MSEIKISVVMSVYNAEKYLREAINSMLNQTFSNFEFIIVNDGSTDGSLKIIESFNDKRMVLINQNNTGLAKALNIGIGNAKSNFIARMDSDDISLPTRLEKQYNFLMQNPEYIAVGSNALIVDVEGNYVFTSFRPQSDEEAKLILPKTPFYHPSVMFKKNIFQKAGKYCEDMIKAQDTVLFNRMAKYGKFYNIREPLIKYRIVPTANTLRSNISNKFTEIIKTAIKNNTISAEDKSFLIAITMGRNSKTRIANYHFFLAKKYIWNNYNPRKSRKNLMKAINSKNFVSLIYLYFITFLPETTIRLLYNFFKNYNNNANIYT